MRMRVVGYCFSVAATASTSAWSAGRMALLAVSKFSFSKVKVRGVASVPAR